ncbi:MAG: putative cullin C [Streblomastix strix]|uniref:Putative cullin C n=1 Tax=Streblomastix strix TaxID=222440 RepID=A0A5J4X6X6_9EUKA|nr:MAG: putative cullin C [Streblomastix strix]
MQKRVQSLNITSSKAWVRFRDEWRWAADFSRKIADFFLYLDKVYAQANHKHTTYNMIMIFFRESVLNKLRLKDDILPRALSEIEKLRNGQNADTDGIETYIQMLSKVSIESKDFYENMFEKSFLEKSKEFWLSESKQINSLSIGNYLDLVQKRLDEESSRCSQIMQPPTVLKAEQTLVVAMVQHHVQKIFEGENGLRWMFREGRTQEVRRLYRILSTQTDALDPLLNEFKKFILQQGEEVCKEKEGKVMSNEPFVEQFVTLKKRFTIFTDDAFMSIESGKADSNFLRALQDTLRKCLNQKPNAAKILAIYLDAKLIKASQQSETLDETLEKQVKDCLDIFELLEEKDIFEAHYKAGLGKRILQKRKQMGSLEQLVIDQLRTICGQQFTNMLEGMQQDMEKCDERAQEFKISLDEKRLKEKQQAKKGSQQSLLPEFEIFPVVLTSTYWPKQTPSRTTITLEMQSLSKLFEEFYQTKFRGRQLRWQHNLGISEIKFNTSKKIYDLDVTTFQMLVLLLYNNSDQISYADILAQTHIEPDDLAIVMETLISPKVKILLHVNYSQPYSNQSQNASQNKMQQSTSQSLLPSTSQSTTDLQSKGSTTSLSDSANESIIAISLSQESSSFEQTDIFSFNTNFTYSSKHLNLGHALLQREMDLDENEAGLPQKTDDDRQYLIDAIIVRTMKLKQKMDISELTKEVQRLLIQRFSPTARLISQRVDSLTEREYLERDKNDRHTFKYLP